jgi:putative component of membrane protein insertase Oxa1/YidC/SpoIIIJ protein YidD
VLRRAALCLLLPALLLAGHDALSIGGEWLINGYKAAVSPLQSRQMCNFWPTCSQFTRHAIREHGFLLGTAMGADRLLRCHQLAWSYVDLHYFGLSHDRISDPVANHHCCNDPAEPASSPSLPGVEPDRVPAGGTRGAVPVADLDFAAHLYNTGDYRRAADEYERVRFAVPDTSTRQFAALMAGEALLKAGLPSRARVSFLRAELHPDLAGYGEARAWFAEQDYERSRAVLSGIPSRELGREVLALEGWSLFRERRFPEAAATFARLPGDTVLGTLSVLDGSDLSRRSRTLGTILSAVLPGSGQVYSGRVADGIYSLLAVAGSGFLTWWFADDPARRDQTRIKVSVFGALTALFYAGNVYGANIAARDYNRLEERRYLSRAEEVLARADLAPDYSKLLPATPEPDAATGRPE